MANVFIIYTDSRKDKECVRYSNTFAEKRNSMRYTIDEVTTAAKYMLEQTAGCRIFAFTAAMGAGKTTLITALCKQLDVVDVPASPTFSIINEYATREGGKLYHLDLYRLKDIEEALQAGVEEVLYSGAYCFVEWPQIAEPILPGHTIRVHIDFVDETTRELSLEQS